MQSKCYLPVEDNFHPDTIVDAGAHIGMASILFTKRYPRAKIIALEPQSANFAALTRNTEVYPNIVPVKAALWKEDGEVILGKSTAHPKGAFQIVESGGERVRAMKMETLMSENGIKRIDLLKMDIESAEKKVFENCDWLKDVGMMAIELHDRLQPGCREMTESAARGFRRYEQGEITFFVRKNE